MKEPFNPIPIPNTLNLRTGNPSPEPSNPDPDDKASTSKSKRRSTRKKGDPAVDPATRWERVKSRLAAKMAQLDKEKLRQVLIGLGVVAGVVAAVILAVKMLPALVTILALLGLGLALQLWDRLRYLPGRC